METLCPSPIQEEVHCFVCDTIISGRYYSLATCRTQTSKTRIIEKLGALVGDQYMVVISEDDVICRACATYMNTMDRLESEALSIRSNVLKFLEKKYELSEGELVNQKNTGLSQPPRVVPSENPGERRIERKGYIHQGNFMARKRKAALTQMAEANEQENIHHKKGLGGPWMQCNTCKYTTSYDSFINHHIVDDISDNNISDSILPTSKGVRLSMKPRVMGNSRQQVNNDDDEAILGRNDDNSRDSDNSETVEMIAAEINDYASQKTEKQTINASKLALKEEPSTIKVQIISQGKQKKVNFGQGENEVMIRLPHLTKDEENPEETTMITDELEPGMSVEDQLMKMNEGDPNTVYVQMVDVEKAADVGATTKQVMTVSDDGTVEMVEVLWDDDDQGGAGDGNIDY